MNDLIYQLRKRAINETPRKDQTPEQTDRLKGS